MSMAWMCMRWMSKEDKTALDVAVDAKDKRCRRHHVALVCGRGAGLGVSVREHCTKL